MLITEYYHFYCVCTFNISVQLLPKYISLISHASGIYTHYSGPVIFARPCPETVCKSSCLQGQGIDCELILCFFTNNGSLSMATSVLTPWRKFFPFISYWCLAPEHNPVVSNRNQIPNSLEHRMCLLGSSPPIYLFKPDHLTNQNCHCP